MNIEKPDFKKLCFMYMQQLTNFPYIEKDFDALTDYELLSLVVKHLNEVIKNTNTQNESITNLYNAFIELKNYVDEFFEDENITNIINNIIETQIEAGTLYISMNYDSTNEQLDFILTREDV